MDALAHAFQAIRIDHGVLSTQVFACKSVSWIREHLRRNHRPNHIQSDVVTCPLGSSEMDLNIYAAGPPYQPWSPLNTTDATCGELDPCVQLFHETITFIRECLPKTFLLEESDTPYRYRQGKWLSDALEPHPLPLYPSWPIYSYDALIVNTCEWASAVSMWCLHLWHAQRRQLLSAIPCQRRPPPVPH